MNTPLAKTISGTSVCVNGHGILVTGDSGIGKSLLALSLLDRAHALICDDATRLIRKRNTIWLQAEQNLIDKLEVRHLGIVSVSGIFGESALKDNIPLKLLIHLQSKNVQPLHYNRLKPNMTSTTVLGLKINQLTLPAEHSNLALLVEVSVKTLIDNHRQSILPTD